MKHVLFKNAVLSHMDEVGQIVLRNAKVWILWIKVISYMLKDEDRMSIYFEALKYGITDGYSLLKEDYNSFLSEKELSPNANLDAKFTEFEVVKMRNFRELGN